VCTDQYQFTLIPWLLAVRVDGMFVEAVWKPLVEGHSLRDIYEQHQYHVPGWWRLGVSFQWQQRIKTY
jgi:hypothetical protein